MVRMTFIEMPPQAGLVLVCVTTHFARVNCACEPFAVVSFHVAFQIVEIEIFVVTQLTPVQRKRINLTSLILSNE